MLMADDSDDDYCKKESLDIDNNDSDDNGIMNKKGST